MPSPLEPDHVPLSTYRLQLRAEGFTFDDAAALVPYLNALGIGDAYLSPFFRAREQSTHGYDVVDHGAVEPAFGGEEALARLSDRLREHRMGLLLDVVPNHMGIDDPANRWWQDVLVHGEGSRYAGHFDIDWDPPVEANRHKVLLPVLGDYFGRVLEKQELRLNYDGGRFWVAYYKRRFPVAPAGWPPILRLMLERLTPVPAADDPVRLELESLITSLERLPPPSDRTSARMRERYRESEVASRRLRELTYYSHPVHAALDAAVAEYNGTQGDPRSFDRLEALLDAQPYRLAFWRVAGDEINYRRFFDINELAAIRVEEPAVFDAVHALTFRLLAQGTVTGLRIDHPDGLFDPPTYFENLQAGYRRMLAEQNQSDQPVSALATGRGGAVPEAEIAPPGRHARSADRSGTCGPLYVVAEKILAHDERLDPDWPVCGTTGYEFLNRLNGLFIAEGGAEAIRGVYHRFTGFQEPFRAVLYDGKRTILDFSMSSELNVLARMLTRIAGRRRESRDFTYGALRRALREVIASFPVYRTYVRPGKDEVRDDDLRRVRNAIRLARRRNPELPKAVFDFLASLLLLEDPDGLTEEQRSERRQFVLKLQQVTGPVMAKGLEDTAFYRYYPLATLNEVGGEPDANGVAPEELHRDWQRRRSEEPFSLSATTTHDTKRGEDLRARLNVLSEIPDEWEQAIGRWRYLNAAHKAEYDGASVPDANEAYLIYQTLVGTWSGGTAPTEDYVNRIVAYCEKAFREAKLHTSWLDPDPDYEGALFSFVRFALDPERSSEFLADLDAFVRRIADAGFLNSLSQLLLKLAAPGVPDFYQGCELWDFRLVDPDNRRSVNFAKRRELLSGIAPRAESDPAGLAAELVAAWPDERIKLYVTWRGLRHRKAKPDLFLRGDYLPLEASGECARHLFSFARRYGDDWLLVAVPRVTLSADRTSGGRIAPAWWGSTHLTLPAGSPRRWRSLFTSRTVDAGASVKAADLFADFPVALWEAAGGT